MLGQGQDGAGERYVEVKGSRETIGLIQRYIPHYRVPFFRMLGARSLYEWEFLCGGHPGGEVSGVTADTVGLTIRPICNHGWGRRGVVWQSGMRRYLRSGGYRAMVFEMGWPIISNWPLVYALRCYGIAAIGWGKVIRTAATPPPPGTTALKRVLLRQCSAFVVYGEVSKEALIELGVAGGRVYVARNTVDVTAIVAREASSKRDGMALREEWGWGPGVRVLGYLGRLSARKAPSILLRAFLRLRAKGHDTLRLVIAGDGPEREPLDDERRRSVYAGDIRIVGSVPDGGEHAYFQAFDLIVSVRAPGLAVMEAMAHAKPVVILPERVPETELIEHRRTGFIAPGDSEGALVAALQDALSCGDLREIGAMARQTVLGRATQERMVESFDQAVAKSLATGS